LASWPFSMSLSASRTVAGANAACFRRFGAGFGFRGFTSPASHQSVLSLYTETFARVGPRETSSPAREARSYLSAEGQVLRPLPRRHGHEDSGQRVKRARRLGARPPSLDSRSRHHPPCAAGPTAGAGPVGP